MWLTCHRVVKNSIKDNMIMPCGWTTLQYNVVPDEDIKDFEDFFDHLEKWKPSHSMGARRESNYVPYASEH